MKRARCLTSMCSTKSVLINLPKSNWTTPSPRNGSRLASRTAVSAAPVVRGLEQKAEDLDDTFASAPSLVTLKLLLTLAAALNWSVTCGDISTAFLHVLITGEDIRVIPPLEFFPEGNVIWKLQRALCGLRNAPRLWKGHFASVMEMSNFNTMKSDPTCTRKHKRRYILCHVDDLVFFGSQPDVQTAISDLSNWGRFTNGKEVAFLGGNLGWGSLILKAQSLL